MKRKVHAINGKVLGANLLECMNRLAYVGYRLYVAQYIFYTIYLLRHYN